MSDYTEGWPALSRRIRRSRGNSCETCGAQIGRIIVHHRNEDRSDNRTSNLQVLCQGCHLTAHDHPLKPRGPGRFISLHFRVKRSLVEMAKSAETYPGEVETEMAGWAEAGLIDLIVNRKVAHPYDVERAKQLEDRDG